MRNEVQLIVTQGDTTTYQSGIDGVSVPLQKIYISELSDFLSCEIYQQLIDEQGFIQVYGESGLLDTVQVDPDSSVNCLSHPYSGTLKYISSNPSLIATGAYFRFTLGSPTEVYLDLYENESISQNWSFTDISALKAVGSYSREFRIPLSQTNQKIFGAIANSNYLNTSTNNSLFNKKIPAEIRVNTLPIIRGHLRVLRVYKELNKQVDVEVVFYAETPDLFRAIGEKKLSDIAALDTLNEPVTYANVTNETADRIWTLCDRAQKWSNDGVAGARPILDANNPVFPADLTPAISWWFLLRNIISEAGFELVASSIENIIEDYWMPFCNTPQLANQGGTNQYFFAAYPDAPFLVSDGFSGNSSYTNMIEAFDNNSDFDPVTGTYTSSIVGNVTFHVRQRFATEQGFSGTNYIIIKLRVLKNGSLATTAWGYFQITQGSLAPQYGLFDQTFTLELEIGDTVIFEYESYQAIAVGGIVNGNLSYTAVDIFENGIIDVYGLAGDGTTDESYIEVNSVEVTVGQTIDYKMNAPDMRQIDLVNDIIKMHNCAIVPSRTVPNRIAIIPQNNYLGTGSVVDWTNKLDISKDISLTSTADVQKASFQFTYTAGEDAYSKLYKNVNRIYGDYKVEGYTINPSTEPSDFATGEQKIQLVTRSTPAARIPNTDRPIPCFYNEQLEFVAPGPRALFNAGIAQIQLYNEVSGAASLTTIPILNHYSNVYPNIQDNDLNWAPEIPPHVSTVIANPYNNLFNAYWRNYMNDLYSPEARIMEAFFALDLADILTFSFADKIWIEDSYWRILEINDYKVGLYESTKVTLIKFLEQINDCSGTPVSVSTNGVVNFVNVDGTPVEATEDCCSRYGYFWDEINGVCWAFNNGGEFRDSIIQNNERPTSVSVGDAPNSIVNGAKISIQGDNGNTLAVGKDLTLTKYVNGSNLLGKNVITNLPGIHVGGGYRGGLSSASVYSGWAQFGFFVLQCYPTIMTSGQTANLYIEGVVDEYINIPEETVWSCVLNVTIQDTTGASETSLHHFTLDKFGGAAGASAITTLNTIGSIGSNVFTFGIDTTTNTEEHRINITFTGGTYPDGFVITSTLQYQQSKTST